jgi:hypothetical protein
MVHAPMISANKVSAHLITLNQLQAAILYHKTVPSNDGAEALFRRAP